MWMKTNILVTLVALVSLFGCSDSMPFKAGEVWEGTYVCSQGETPLVFTVEEVKENTVKAKFEFKFGRKKGSYRVIGNYSSENREFEFMPDKWINRPAGVSRVGLKGTIDKNGSNLRGTITNPSCDWVKLKKQAL